MITINIKKGWFYAAGNIYGWIPEFHSSGVGIDMETLKHNPNIEIMVDDIKYDVDCVKALNFINRCQSVKYVGRDRKLGVISKSILKPV